MEQLEQPNKPFSFKDLVKIVPSTDDNEKVWIVIGNSIASPNPLTREEAEEMVDKFEWDMTAVFISVMFDAYQKRINEENNNKKEEDKE